MLGKILVTMDGDLQNDPEDIPRFMEKIGEGYDIVCGWREKRQDKLVTRKIPSKVANWLIGRVTGVPIRDNGCSLKAYRREVIQKIPLYSEMHRFIPAMASIAGSRIAQIPVRHHARKFGESKYGLSRIYKVLLDLLMIKTVCRSPHARCLVRWNVVVGRLRKPDHIRLRHYPMEPCGGRFPGGPERHLASAGAETLK
jgi:glycosyltransferase involved in cell wall biosynthesis